MKIVGISDIHQVKQYINLFNETFKEHVFNEIDLVCIAGDISDTASEISLNKDDFERNDLRLINFILDKFPNAQCVAITGNHDSYASKVNNRRFRWLNNKITTLMIDGYSVKIGGCNLTSFDWYGTTYFKYNVKYNASVEEEILKQLRKFKTCDIVLTHQPPLAILDSDCKSDLKGSSALRFAIDSFLQNVKLFVCGHIHRGANEISSYINPNNMHIQSIMNASVKDGSYMSKDHLFTVFDLDFTPNINDMILFKSYCAWLEYEIFRSRTNASWDVETVRTCPRCQRFGQFPTAKLYCKNCYKEIRDTINLNNFKYYDIDSWNLFEKEFNNERNNKKR